uniref:Protein kinase domain-containing protein n=1 Tax=Tetraodon nigroviridis TaxID=99883 RepID=H3CG68_TETNG
MKMNKISSNRANMLREVQLMNRLSHPSILRFVGVCVHEGQLHALTEVGKHKWTIQKHLHVFFPVTKQGISYDLIDTAVLLILVALTSQNCLIKCDDSGYSAVIGDFGLAEKIPTNPEKAEREKLSVVGSPYWMAPELLRDEVYNEKADIFSYGIILCEIIARIQADPDCLPRTE